MKKQVLAAVLGLVLAQAAQAEKWQGTGQVASPDGQAQGDYQVSTEVTAVSQGVKQSNSHMTFADGSYKDINMTITISGNKFSTKSALGDGDGACYANDVCESYIDAGQGHGFATTIIRDGETMQRHLTVELQNGKAVRVISEKLTRVE